MTDDERRSFGNLILLCHPHHTVVDKTDSSKFTIQILRSWKIARETPGQAALAGLREVTESRLQELISGAIKSYDDRVGAALDELRKIDPQSAALMRDLNAELKELRGRGPILDEDVVNSLRSAAHDLRIALDEGIVNKLYDAGRNLRYLDEGVINQLESAARDLRRLGDY